MAFKQFALDEQTSVTIYKRRRSRSLKLTVSPEGKICVSIPAWAPYSAGLQFAKSKRAWIQTQRQPNSLLSHDQPIGKAHRLEFRPSLHAAAVSSRIRGSSVAITFPATLTQHSPAVQKAAREAGIRALRRQAEQLLPQRLAELASQYGFTYNSLKIKRLKSRWGSCDQRQNIVLNLFLMQLSWELIDYVIIHELVHTEVLKHGPEFWHAMERVMPDAKARRKRMRDHHPVMA